MSGSPPPGQQPNGSQAPSAGQQQPSASGGAGGAVVVEKPLSVLEKRLEQWQAVSKKLNGAENAKHFFDTFGTDDGEPKPEKKVSDSEKAAIRARELLKDQKLDLGLKDRSKQELGLPVRPPGYGAAFLSNDWTIKAIGGVDNPTTLENKAWKVIMDTTKALHGYVIYDDGTLRKARKAAFKYKEDDGVNFVKPAFEVYDDSNIEIKESNSSMERSMVKNGFSSRSAQASVSGGAWGVSASASGGFNQETQDNKSESELKDKKEYTATYNFPRARVFIEDADVKLTPGCVTLIEELRNAAKLIKDNDSEQARSAALGKALALRDKFYRLYGHMFVSDFQLGGQLTSSKFADSIAGTAETDKRDAMKISAALSVESKFGGGSASYSQETNEQEKTRSIDVKGSSALAWNARGGNTLLCANPSEWANSVASFQTWRAIEQGGIMPLTRFIGQLTEGETNDPLWSDVPELFDALNRNEYQKLPDVPKGTWTGKITLETQDGRKLINKDGSLCLTARDDRTTPALVLNVLDADWDAKAVAQPKMPQLYEDWPLFLSTKENPVRSTKFGSQIPGLWVDSDGTIKTEDDPSQRICRWSLRSKGVDFQTPWKPHGHFVVQDGDNVLLHCHSYFSGAYRSVDSAPYYSPNVHTKSDGAVKVVKSDSTALDVEYKLSTVVWQPLWSSRESGTKPDFLKPGNLMFNMMERYDMGQESKDELAQIDTFRKLYGVLDPENLEELSPWFDSSSSQARDAAMTKIPQSVRNSWTDWDIANGDFMNKNLMAETRFTVKYVYPK